MGVVWDLRRSLLLTSKWACMKFTRVSVLLIRPRTVIQIYIYLKFVAWAHQTYSPFIKRLNRLTCFRAGILRASCILIDCNGGFDRAALAKTAHRAYGIHFKWLNVGTGVLSVIYATRVVVSLPIHYSTRLCLVLYRQLDHTPLAINHVKHSAAHIK